MISYEYATDGTKLRALYATGTNNILSPIGVLNTNVDNDISVIIVFMSMGS